MAMCPQIQTWKLVSIDVNMHSESGMGLVYMGLRQVWHWFICEFVLRSASLCPQIQVWGKFMLK